MLMSKLGPDLPEMAAAFLSGCNDSSGGGIGIGVQDVGGALVVAPFSNVLLKSGHDASKYVDGSDGIEAATAAAASVILPQRAAQASPHGDLDTQSSRDCANDDPCTTGSSR